MTEFHEEGIDDMATVLSPDGQVSRFTSYIQPAINVLLAAAIIGLFVVRDTANAAYNGVQQHERRIEALESNPVRISILETSMAVLIDQNKRLEGKVDKLNEQLSDHMARSHGRSQNQ
jgi:hypothetical protein